MKKIIALTLAGIMLAVAFMSGFTSTAVAAEPGSSADNPIFVSRDEVPENVEITKDGCAEVANWSETKEVFSYGIETRFRELVPGEHHEAVTHEEYKYKKTVPAVAEVSHNEYRYERTVDVFKTKYQYKKQVRGEIWQQDNGKGKWHKTGQRFDWKWYSPASTQWSFEDKAVLQSGPHSAVVSEYMKGNHRWQERSTEYQYVKSGVTEQVKTGTTKETSDWRETAPAGSGWKVIDTRKVVDSPAIPESVEYSGWVKVALGAPWVLIDTKTVVDREAYTEPDTYTDWTDWILLEKDLPKPPNVPENEEFVEFRATEPEYEGNVTTYYAYTDDAVCPPTETTPPTEPTPPVETTVPPTEPTAPPTTIAPPVSEKTPKAEVGTPKRADAPKPKPTNQVLPNTGGSATMGVVATAIVLIAMGSAVLIQRKRRD